MFAAGVVGLQAHFFQLLFQRAALRAAFALRSTQFFQALLRRSALCGHGLQCIFCCLYRAGLCCKGGIQRNQLCLQGLGLLCNVARALFAHSQLAHMLLHFAVLVRCFAVPRVDLRALRADCRPQCAQVRVARGLGAAPVAHRLCSASGAQLCGCRGGLRCLPVKAVPDAQRGTECRGHRLQLTGALRLTLQCAQARPDLRQNILQALRVARGLFQLAQCVLAFLFVHPNAGRFFKQCAAFLGFERERGVHQPLAHYRIRALRQAHFSEQFSYVAQARLLAVEDVLVLSVAVGPAHQRDFAELNRQPLVGIVKEDVGAGHAGARPQRRAVEDHVFRFAPAQQRKGLLAQHPAQAVGDVALA